MACVVLVLRRELDRSGLFLPAGIRACAQPRRFRNGTPLVEGRAATLGCQTRTLGGSPTGKSALTPTATSYPDRPGRDRRRMSRGPFSLVRHLRGSTHLWGADARSRALPLPGCGPADRKSTRLNSSHLG